MGRRPHASRGASTPTHTHAGRRADHTPGAGLQEAGEMWTTRKRPCSDEACSDVASPSSTHPRLSQIRAPRGGKEGRERSTCLPQGRQSQAHTGACHAALSRRVAAPGRPVTTPALKRQSARVANGILSAEMTRIHE